MNGDKDQWLNLKSKIGFSSFDGNESALAETTINENGERVVLYNNSLFESGKDSVNILTYLAVQEGKRDGITTYFQEGDHFQGKTLSKEEANNLNFIVNSAEGAQAILMIGKVIIIVKGEIKKSHKTEKKLPYSLNTYRHAPVKLYPNIKNSLNIVTHKSKSTDLTR